LKIFHPLLAQILCLLMLVGITSAQPLPKIELKQVFPNLKIDQLVWMSEAPDGSGRFFAVGQAGKILVFKKASDGGDAKEFIRLARSLALPRAGRSIATGRFHPARQL
jgi:hypothetical protein